MARYQYETSPRKIEPDYIPNRKSRRQLEEERALKEKIKKEAQEKANKKRAALALKKKIFIYIGIAFVMLLVISYRNSLITEDFNKVKSLKEELATLQKENQQTEVSIESNVNLTKIEAEAKSKLGMQKLTNDQKIYINLPKRDYVQSSTDDNKDNTQKSWISKILDKIKGN